LLNLSLLVYSQIVEITRSISVLKFPQYVIYTFKFDYLQEEKGLVITKFRFSKSNDIRSHN